MTSPAVIDVSSLPTFAFGHRSILWWGTMGIVVIESTVFVLLIASYFYFQTRAPQWPPGVPPPDLSFGIANTLVLLVSCIPNQLAKKAAERLDLGAVRIWLVVCLLFAAVFLVIRVFEFRALNCWWDTNAYGSVVWTLLGVHTAHLLTDFLDTAVLAALIFIGPVEQKRFVDVAENGMYWYFVVLAWLPIAAVIYLAPRWL